MISFWAPQASGFAYLSEFVGRDNNEIRYEASGLSSDEIKHPQWENSSVNIVLCTGGTAIQNTKLRQSGSNSALNDSQWRQKILADLNTAISSWNDSPLGSAVSLNTATANSDCGPNMGQTYGGNDGVNQIFFNSVYDDGVALPRGVLGFTVLSLEVQNGELVIVDADIILNAMNYSNYSDSEYYDPAGILTHELGHFLGIAHSLVSDDNSVDEVLSSATMYPKVLGSGNYLSVLAFDDVIALQNLYPSTNQGGILRGAVFNHEGVPLRGAQVSVFSLEENSNILTNTSITAAISGLSQTRTTTDGSFEIRAIPLHVNFIIFVEPIERPDIDPSAFRYSVINSPIKAALTSEQMGLQSFIVEGYPDVPIVDLRKIRNANSSPGISAARTFRFTSNGQAFSDLNFYISNIYSPPNDALFTELLINPKTSGSGTVEINNSNPVQLFVELPTELKIFENDSLRLIATKASQSFDWSSSIPDFEWEAQSATITIGLPSPRPQNGSYQLKFSLEDSKYGNFEVTRTIEVKDWTQSSASVVFGTRPSADESSGGGGGCHLRKSEFMKTLMSLYAYLLFMILLSFYLRRYYLKKR